MDGNVTIVVESKKYEVSRRKLAERSPYFEAMFYGEFLERYKTTVNIKGIYSDAWEEILYYLDTGKIRSKPFNSILHKKVLKLLVTSDMLLFFDIREVCLESLMDILTPDSALEIFYVASKLGVPCLIHKSRTIALWNADIITYTEGFYNMGVDDAEGYLNDPGLRSTRGEWGVWEAVNRWIISDSDPERSRNKYLPRLIKCLSLKYLSPSNLRTLSVHAGVRSNPIVSAAVRGLLYGNVIAPEVSDFIDSWRSTPQRRLPFVPGVVAYMSENSGEASPYIVRFCLEERKFIPFLRLDEVERNVNYLEGFTVIAEGCKLYMLGGEITNRSMAWYLAIWEYDQIIERWQFVANLRRGTRHAAVCIIGTDLFVLGGFGPNRRIQDTVSKLSLRDKKWTSCAPLPRPLYAVPCCAFKGKIYAVKAEIHEYDPGLDMWELVCITLPPGEVFYVATTNEDYIFITGLSRTVYRFDPTQRDPQLVEVGTFEEECTEACIVDEHIYNVYQQSYGEETVCERIHIRTGHQEILWRGDVGDEFDTFSPDHYHGCLPLLMY